MVGSRCAIVTGIAGQAGSYLAELLLSKGYYVFGMVRRTSSDTCRERLLHLENTSTNLRLMYGDLTDIASISNIINTALQHSSFVDADVDANGELCPLEIYNLAAQSHVQVSFETPIYTVQADGVGVLHFLETIRQLPPSTRDRVRFYQACTSEMFGASPAPQRESTPFYPRSPYGVAKLYSYWITRNYREAYGLWTCAAVLFNHESERRCKNFVTRKVTCAVAKYANSCELYKPLQLGNLDAKRDWGYAPEYVNAIWLMMQKEIPKDYVIGTGVSHTVRELVETAFGVVNVSLRWENNDDLEKGYNASTGELLVEVNPRYYRPAEVDDLCGDASLARAELGWQPTITFNEMIERMVKNDIAH